MDSMTIVTLVMVNLLATAGFVSVFCYAYLLIFSHEEKIKEKLDSKGITFNVVDIVLGICTAVLVIGFSFVFLKGFINILSVIITIVVDMSIVAFYLYSRKKFKE